MQIIFKLHANRHPLPLLLHPGRGNVLGQGLTHSQWWGVNGNVSLDFEGVLYPGEHAVSGTVLLPVLGWQPLVQLTPPSSFQY